MASLLGRSLSIFALVMTHLASPLWAAQGTGAGSGGGADALVHGGRVVLADAKGVVRGKPLAYEGAFSPELRARFNDVFLGRLLSSYDQVGSSQLKAMIRDLVTNRDNEYFYMDELPEVSDCLRPVKYPQLSDPRIVQRVACTMGVRTWILKNLFDQMTLDDQILVLAHEGMRRKDIDDQTIFRITAGLGVALAHWDAQMQGRFERLSDHEVELIQDSLQASLKTREISAVGGSVSNLMDNVEVWPNGGAFRKKKNSEVDPSAFLGVGVIIAHGKISGGARLLRTDVCAYWHARTRCQIGQDVVIEDYLGMGGIIAARGAVVRNSRAHFLHLGEDALVENSDGSWGGVIGTRATVRNMSIQASHRIVLEPRARLENFELTTGTDNGVITAAHFLTFGQMWWFVPDDGQALVFTEGTEIVLGRVPLCPNGKSEISTANFLNKTFEIRSLKDLKSYCDR